MFGKWSKVKVSVKRQLIGGKCEVGQKIGDCERKKAGEKNVKVH